MDTDAVRLFVMAAEMLNISAAGRRLGLAPAVASARLAKLEGQLGADLLHRSTRKVSLSLAGAEFLPFAREILAQEDAAKAALGFGRVDVTGTIRFAAPSSFAQLYIAPIIPEFIERHPGVSLQLRLSDAQVDLIEGGYDLALRNAALEDSTLRARKLADDTRVLCASPAYLDRYGRPAVPEDLAQHRTLAFRDAAARTLSAGPGVATSLFPPPGAKRRVIVDDGTSLRIATLAGGGISMNALWSVHAELAAGSLERVLPDYVIEDRSALWLVYPKANILTAKVRVFIDFLLEKIGQPPVWER
ncbi:MAG: LysR substrate-binding domain-containing protein [Pseudomonadota bacterium]